MARPGEELLRCLVSGDVSALRAVQTLKGSSPPLDLPEAVLSPKVRALVRLAALVAQDASTTSLRWAVERASCVRANEDEIAGVLVSIGADVGAAQVVRSAPRLALAIGYDVEGDSPDEA